MFRFATIRKQLEKNLVHYEKHYAYDIMSFKIKKNTRGFWTEGNNNHLAGKGVVHGEMSCITFTTAGGKDG